MTGSGVGGGMALGLALLSGVCWTIAYIELIRLGLRDRTCGMPLFALALNIAWEAFYGYLGVTHAPGAPQSWINVVWCLLDLGIVYTHFRFGREHFPRAVRAALFWPWSLLVFLMAFAVQIAFHAVMGRMQAVTYSAFIQNLIMSVLFIGLLLGRGNTRGQSRLIAVSKWLGTLAPTLLLGVLQGDPLVAVLGAGCFVFDLVYLGLLDAALRARPAAPLPL